MNIVLEKYKDLTPKNDEATTNLMWADLIGMSKQDQQRIWLRDGVVGDVCVYHKSPEYPDSILEYVQGSKEDSVTTLYKGNSLFMDLSRLRDARKELITEIGAVLMAIPSHVTIYDEGREREAFLNELGTAQLVDVLIRVTGSHLSQILLG
jgi:hypothetical protein